MTILVTGAAGFIGYHAARALLARGDRVVGADCLTPYYDVALKRARLADLSGRGDFVFDEIDLADSDAVMRLFERERPTRVLHLAAQAGVRYSLENPFAYARSNVNGHLSVLEAARRTGCADHVVYASSSSVYGDRATSGGGFKETDPVDRPVSLYAATKRADELMSETYAHLYGMSLTGLRFFTVYGPWGRPDMAYFSFAEKMIAGRPIDLFNEGRNRRDFTFVDDIVPHLLAILDDAPGPGHRLFNIGGSQPVDTLTLVSALERALGVTAKTRLVPPQPGDVALTHADTSALEAAYGPAPKTPLEDGVAAFAAWYKDWAGLRSRAV